MIHLETLDNQSGQSGNFIKLSETTRAKKQAYMAYTPNPTSHPPHLTPRLLPPAWMFPPVVVRGERRPDRHHEACARLESAKCSHSQQHAERAEQLTFCVIWKPFGTLAFGLLLLLCGSGRRREPDGRAATAITYIYMPGGATYGAAADFNKFEDDQIRWITVHELHDRQTAGEELVLYDVRDQRDYSAGTIPGAEHLPQGDMFLNLLSMKPRILEAATKAAHAELVLFANTGGVNGPAASRDLYVLNVLVLEEFGGVPLNRILRLKGGLNEWKAAGFACAPPPRPKVAGSIEVLLEDASLAHLAAQLEGQSLESLQDVLACGGRTTILNALKDRGLKRPDRQELTNAIQRTVRRAGGGLAGNSS